MKFFHKVLTGIFLALFISLVSSGQVFAQSSLMSVAPSSSAEATPESAVYSPPLEPVKPEYSRGKVLQIIDEERFTTENGTFYTQKVKIKNFKDNKDLEVEVGNQFAPLSAQQRLTVGTVVVLAKQEVSPGESQYIVADVYRLPGLLWLAIGFAVLVIVIAKKQGAFSIVGTFVSLFILMSFTIPQILAGHNPILISIIGCTIDAVISIYLCHGFNVKTHIALLSMFGSLVAVGLLSVAAVKMTHLTGLGSEDASYLQFGQTAKINLQGLLLGGIMLGALGVLDDICISQVSLIQQLKAAKPNISFKELYERGLSVGKDHIASLVNTLVLAYAGASLPLFLLFTLNNMQPVWVSLNSEVIIEELVRTLTGSMGLVLAVPLSTFIAAFWLLRMKTTEVSSDSHPHAHGHHH